MPKNTTTTNAAREAGQNYVIGCGYGHRIPGTPSFGADDYAKASLWARVNVPGGCIVARAANVGADCSEACGCGQSHKFTTKPAEGTQSAKSITQLRAEVVRAKKNRDAANFENEEWGGDAGDTGEQEAYEIAVAALANAESELTR